MSILAEDVEFIDRYANRHGVSTRSGVIRRALTQLRSTELGDDYAAAWQEWSTTEAGAWEAAAGDGLDDTANR